VASFDLIHSPTLSKELIHAKYYTQAQATSVIRVGKIAHIEDCLRETIDRPVYGNSQFAMTDFECKLKDSNEN